MTRLFAEKRLIVLIFLLLALLALTGRYIAVHVKSEERSLAVIAVVVPSSDREGSVGMEMVRTARLMRSWFERDNPDRDFDIELRIYDDGDDPQRALEVAREVVVTPAVLAVVGHHDRKVVEAVAPVYADAKLPFINPTLSSVDPQVRNETFYRTRLDKSGIGVLTANYILQTSGVERAYIIHDLAQGEKEITQAFVNVMEEQEIPVITLPFDGASTTLEDDLFEIIDELGAVDPGVVYIDAAPKESVTLLQSRDDWVAGQIIVGGGDAFYSAEFLRLLRLQSGEDWKSKLEGILFGAQLMQEMMNEVAASFQLVYRSHYAQPPETSAFYMRDAMSLALKAVKSAMEESATRNRLEVLEEFLNGVDSQENGIEGVGGLFFFDGHGGAVMPLAMATFVNGQILPAPLQMHAAPNGSDSSTRAFSAMGQSLALVDVVYTGVLLRKVMCRQPHVVDKTSGSKQDVQFRNVACDLYNADGVELEFDLWFRSRLGVAADTVSFFGNEELQLIDPIETAVEDGVEYRRYRIAGTFKTNGSLTGMPLGESERRTIDIRLLNKKLSERQVRYVMDPIGMGLKRGKSNLERLKNGILPKDEGEWVLSSFYSEIHRQEHMGNPSYLGLAYRGNDPSGFSHTLLSLHPQGTFQEIIPRGSEVFVLMIASVLLLLFFLLLGIDNGKFYPLLFIPLVTLIAVVLIAAESAALVMVKLQFHEQMVEFFLRWSELIWWLTATVILNLAVHVFVWQRVERKSRREVPTVLKAWMTIFITTVMGFAVSAFVFDLSIFGALAASSAVLLPIGFALRPMILDLFSALAVNMEQPFRIKDWIEVHASKPILGRVEGVTWRSVQLWTIENNAVSIPVHLISEVPMTNYSRPSAISRFEYIFHVGFEVPQEKVLRLVDHGLHDVVEEGWVLKEPHPKVRINSLTDKGVEYCIRYCLDLTRTSPSKGQDFLSRAILNQLSFAGVRPSYEAVEIHRYQDNGVDKRFSTSEGKVAVLQEVDFLNSLSRDDLTLLAHKVVVKQAENGEVIVHEGEQGESMFIVVEGVLGVDVSSAGEDMLRLSVLRPGDYFGEMSLLVGEARSATVRALGGALLLEIDFEAMNELLHYNEEIAVILAQKAARNLSHQRKQLEITQDLEEINKAEENKNILDNIKKFFSL